MPVSATNIREVTLANLARRIRADWKRPYFAAVPYLDAMMDLDAVNPAEVMYGADSGVEVVVYFLSNAATWRGPVAREIKAELKRRVK